VIAKILTGAGGLASSLVLIETQARHQVTKENGKTGISPKWKFSLIRKAEPLRLRKCGLTCV